MLLTTRNFHSQSTKTLMTLQLLLQLLRLIIKPKSKRKKFRLQIKIQLISNKYFSVNCNLSLDRLRDQSLSIFIRPNKKTYKPLYLNFKYFKNICLTPKYKAYKNRDEGAVFLFRVQYWFQIFLKESTNCLPVLTRILFFSCMYSTYK